MKTGMRNHMKWPEYVLALVFMCASSPEIFAAATDEPSYEETKMFIAGLVRKEFVERDHCNFIYDDNLRFSAKALNSMPKTNNWEVTFSCIDPKGCIDPRNSNKLGKSISFGVEESKNVSKVAKAISHLIKLCGGTVVRSDLFD